MSGTTTINSYIDPSNKFLAITLDRPNRIQIRIYGLEKEPELVSDFELDSEDRISCICWCLGLEKVEAAAEKQEKKQQQQETKNRKRSHDEKNNSIVKRNGNDDNGYRNSNNGGSIDNYYLVVCLEQGDILIFSPFQKDIVNKISNESKIISLVGKSDNFFYGYELNSNTIKKFSIFQNKAIWGKSFTQDKSINLIKFLPQDNDFLLLSSNCLYIVDIKDLPKALHRFPVPRGHTSKITSIVLSLENQDIIATSRENDNIIHVYSISKKNNISILETSSNVNFLKIIMINNTEYLIAFLKDGNLNFFKDFKKIKKAKNDLIKAFIEIESNYNDNFLKDVYIKSNKQQQKRDDLYAVWYDDINPVFEKIEFDEIKGGKFIINTKKDKVNGNEKILPKINQNENGQEFFKSPSIDIEDKDEYHVTTSDELYQHLKEQLDSKTTTTDDSILFKICDSNISENIVKTTVLTKLSTDQSLQLFTKLSQKISEQPSESSGLSIWLKFLLLVHGNSIIKSEDNLSILKNLRSSLLDSTKYLSNLIALQGKLYLLKSQLQLRNEMTQLSLNVSDEEESDAIEEEDDEVEDIEEENGPKQNGNATHESTLVYLNGEADDDTVYLDADDVEDAEDAEDADDAEEDGEY
ncbi:hypothetical protein PACTADRAFT_35507 [Pachysolen tannophilus NRRL Y-2460]|uniref:Small-subunit processome Utp12 domain-containing protein n=1 Tax=Pachysolen tannophilus NRRL Y-2460 TaxID=669874 RepID=A0A1E4TPR4_PACTA|nr:hypothetical protein PACTADRAFT_35507 [Pachysolen tannophilus NRRL Y-2460]